MNFWTVTGYTFLALGTLAFLTFLGVFVVSFRHQVKSIGKQSELPMPVFLADTPTIGDVVRNMPGGTE